MSGTQFKTVTSEAWVLASDGFENVLISHTSVWPLQYFRGEAEPTSGDGFHTFDASQPYSMSGLSGQKVYVRCSKPGKSVVIAVDAV